MSTIQPRPQQVDALTDLARAFAIHDRVQLVMACGTGKTLVGRWHAQATEAQRTLVFLPSLSLLAQTLGEWRRPHGWPFEALVVCSDPTTAAGAAERRSDEGTLIEVDRPYWSRARAKVTTSPAEAAKFLTRKVDGRPQVVFCTYHSAPVVAEALARARVSLDLAVYDEAHRLAGRPREAFRVAIDRRKVGARKRLFMTATPHIATGDDVLSMDDASVFGPVAHTVTFGEAIDARLLADYQVLVIADHGGGPDPEREGQTAPAALLDAVRQHDIRRMLTFHSRVAKAAAFAETMDMVHAGAHRLVRARYAAGAQSAGERADTLSWLRADHPREVRVVASARCLAEGIDVPAVDAVMFADQRTSVVDIIQAVGRVLRPSPGKTRGSIIIPVALPPDGDDDTALALSRFGHVWAVLRGLRAHDQRLADELDRAVREGTRRGSHHPTDRIQFLLPDGVDHATVQLRLVQEVGSAWEKFYAATYDWAFTHAGDRLPRNLSHRGVGIGEWAAAQRTARGRGLLTTERVRRLEEIPGWYWDRSEADWADTYQLLEAYAAAYETVADNPAGQESKFAGVHSRGGNKWRLGVWMAQQRQLHRDGMLDQQRARLLEKLPGWDWSGGLREQDVAMVQALRLFVEFEKHAEVPEAHTEDGLPLGRWVWAVRRAHLLGRVPPALVDELAAACPRDLKGASLWRWEKTETQWRLSYSALRQYTARERRVPTGKVVEELDGTRVGIGQWVARQRFLHRRGELDDKYVGWLEAVPGWQWEVALGGEYSEPIDLGGWPHGTAKGIAAGCKCHECLDTRRASDRRYLARGRQLADPVPAGQAGWRIAQLEEAGVRRGALVSASRVPLGVIRKVASGEWTHLERDHERMLLAVTAEQCRAAAATRVGSRGRSAMLDHDRVPAGPTWQILDDLAARGLGKGWVARELGYTRCGLQIGREVISRRIADQVADLAQRVGDLRYSRARRNQKLPPPLAELQRGQAS